jgi:hypothetical protein
VAPKYSDEQIRDAYYRLGASPEGQIILADLQGKFAGRRRCWQPGKPDSTAFNLGQQDVVWYIEETVSRADRSGG